MFDYVCRDAYRGDLSREEMAALEEAARAKALALNTISNREKEILAIADGLLSSKQVIYVLIDCMA